MAEAPRLELRHAPVALFVFNRPAFTAQVLDAIARARPARLLVVGDGPRPDHPDDPELVRATRATLERVDWPCEVSTCFSEHNLGCGERVASGLDWVFANVDEAILLEDDCLPEPSFFRYCEELLDRYRDDERVHMISGCNVLEPGRSGPDSYYFSRCYHIWGWATWSRAWRHYDFEMRRWPELRETDWVERHLRNERGGEIARVLFDGTYSGRIKQWDFQWVLAGWIRDALSATPSVNLVRNIGFGEAATHLRDPNHPNANLTTSPMPFPLRHPPDVVVLEEADQAEWDLVSPNYPRLRDGEPVARRLRSRLRGGLGRGQRALNRLAARGSGGRRAG
jgi:hypothetical protein